MNRIAAVLLCLSFAVQSVAQEVARVHNTADGSTGSGTLIHATNGSGLILTVDHIVRDAPSGPYTVVSPRGRGYQAQLVARRPSADLALLEITDPDWEPSGVAEAVAGQTVTMVGVTGGTRQAVVKSINTVDANRTNLPLSMPAFPGDSGGGIFDSERRLVGVIWGSDETEGVATSGEQLRQLLEGLEVASGDKIEVQQCRPGQPCYPSYPARPSRPIVVTPSPPRVAVPPPSQPGCADCDCAARIAALEKQLEALTAKCNQPGVPGPAGPAGPQGAQGPAGAPGKDAAVDMDSLTAAVLKKLPPIRMRQSDPYTGAIVDDELVYLGDAITLKTTVVRNASGTE